MLCNDYNRCSTGCDNRVWVTPLTQFVPDRETVLLQVGSSKVVCPKGWNSW